MLFCKKESEIQDLWNRESQSNINRSDGGSSTLDKTPVKLYILQLFKQSVTFNGESWSLIDKGIFYSATFNLKIIIFNVYKKFLVICNSFTLLQKLLKFLWYFHCNSPLVYSQNKNYVYLFLWCPFSSLKLLTDFGLNASFSGAA